MRSSKTPQKCLKNITRKAQKTQKKAGTSDVGPLPSKRPATARRFFFLLSSRFPSARAVWYGRTSGAGCVDPVGWQCLGAWATQPTPAALISDRASLETPRGLAVAYRHTAGALTSRCHIQGHLGPGIFPTHHKLAFFCRSRKNAEFSAQHFRHIYADLWPIIFGEFL
jgi:hypothetical protein